MELDTDKVKELATIKNQPIKIISYQDLLFLNDTIDQIHSWIATLSLINNFFANSKNPLNKKKIIKEFHANSYLFATFYEDFLLRTTTLEKQIKDLKARPKVRI